VRVLRRRHLRRRLGAGVAAGAARSAAPIVIPELIEQAAMRPAHGCECPGGHSHLFNGSTWFFAATRKVGCRLEAGMTLENY
jgi:hypothetical protein